MRIVAMAVLISMSHVPAAFAGDTLREAAVRAADQLGAAEAAAARAPETKPLRSWRSERSRSLAKPRASYQQTPRGLEGASGIGTRMKNLIGVGVAAALTGIMLSIDGEVEDNTPSTKGERTNEPF